MRCGVHLWVYCALFTCAALLSRSAWAQEPGGLPKTEQTSDVGRPCDENFFKPCPDPLVCVDFHCVPKDAKTSTTTAVNYTPDIDELPVPKTERSPPRALRLGVQNSFFVGFAGSIRNPQPAYTLTADFGFPTGRRARWHVELGYQNVNGYDGFRINPFVLGYTIPVLSKPIHLEVEIVAAILQSEVLFNDGFSIALSSGLRGAIVAVYDLAFVAFSPIGFEIRYAYGVEDVGIDTGVGANWPFMLTVGVEL